MMEGAVCEAAEHVQAVLGDASADLVLLFISEHHAEDYPVTPAALRRYFPAATIIGCSGGGVVGGGREVEHSPAVSLTVASLPGVKVEPFYLDPAECDRMVETPDLWKQRLAPDPAWPVHFILLPDPFSSDARGLAGSLDAAFPSSGTVGGLASGGQQPGENALFVDDEVVADGAVGVALSGPIDMDTIVAQGCRPVGPPLFITKAFRNRILELDGQKPTDVLADIHDELPLHDQRLFRSSLFAGVVMTEGLQEYGHGDFLIRNIVGVDPDSGMIAIGELVTPGQIVQFHIRDARTSARDLDALLERYRSSGAPEPSGALLFSCLGRGENLYGEADHDSRMIDRHLGPLPIGGFFCQGEIGPVNRQTFLHGYTSSIALFRERPRDEA